MKSTPTIESNRQAVVEQGESEKKKREEANSESTPNVSLGRVWPESYDIPVDGQIALGTERTNPAALMLAHLLPGNIRLDRKRDADNAILDFNEVQKQWSKEPMVYTARGRAWAAKGEIQKAMADYSIVLQLEPKNADMHNRCAWIWATSPIDQVRNGAKAVSSAELACSLTNSKSWSYLDTLAAAYASAGQFSKAVETAQKSVDLAPEAKKSDLNSRLELYRSGKPYIAAR